MKENLPFPNFTVQLEWEVEVTGQDSIIVVDNIMVSSGGCPVQAQTCDFEYENGVDKYCGGKVLLLSIKILV